MKLEFTDKDIQAKAIDLYFDIPDNIERDITVKSADITWSLNINLARWGIDEFNYALSNLKVFVLVETFDAEFEQTNETELCFEVKRNSKTNKYECTIFEEVLKDGAYVDEAYVTLPIELVVEEKPATEIDNRAQIFVKYIDLDLNREDKKLTLTI